MLQCAAVSGVVHVSRAAAIAMFGYGGDGDGDVIMMMVVILMLMMLMVMMLIVKVPIFFCATSCVDDFEPPPAVTAGVV